MGSTSSSTSVVRRLLRHRLSQFVLIWVVATVFLVAVGRHTSIGSSTLSNVLPSRLRGSPTPAYAVQQFLHQPIPKVETGNTHNPERLYNDAKLRKLAACMGRGDCHPNAHKIVIFAVGYCHQNLFGNYGGGEGVWCTGMRNSLERQGYTVLYAHGHDWDYVYSLYRQFPDLVVNIAAEDESDARIAKPFYKSASNPNGVPAWKHFRFWYYATDYGGGIVGDKWMMTCEPEWREPGHDFRNFTYMGYALEPDLAHTEVIPFEQRPVRAYLLGKHQTFFYVNSYVNRIPWERDWYEKAAIELRKTWPDFEFVSSFIDERDEERQKKEGPMPLPKGIRNLPRLNATEFDYEIANSRVLVGIGNPTASPSPYRALARGVPFVSPYRFWEGGKDEDPYSWSDSQHDSLRLETPPRVYHVREQDYEGFVNAIRSALETPIEPYVYPRMTQEALDARIRDWMETDWKAEAQRILDLRVAGVESQHGNHLGLFEV